jgi:hypothetical protein
METRIKLHRDVGREMESVVGKKTPPLPPPLWLIYFLISKTVNSFGNEYLEY